MQGLIELGHNIDELDLDRITTTYIWRETLPDGNVDEIKSLIECSHPMERDYELEAFKAHISISFGSFFKHSFFAADEEHSAPKLLECVDVICSWLDILNTGTLRNR